MNVCVVWAERKGGLKSRAVHTYVLGIWVGGTVQH